ncbi:MAG: NAD(P)H-dependent oxidoreductase [Anaerolineae bacterium]|nr:NAD(P)H-dependent oxidoreductase [Anaerolineae bacterium]
MKILAIIGSPHRGETYQAVQMVEEKMKSLGQVDFEYLWLKENNLKDCTGCHICIKQGEEKCPLKDDTALIEQKIMEADGIIFASPVYVLSISALLKKLFDHFAYLWHRPRFFGKYVLAVASGGGQFKETLDCIKLNAVNLNMVYVNGIGVPHYNDLVPAMQKKVITDINKTAESFYQTVAAKKLPSAGLGDLIRFRVWRINAIAGAKTLVRDYQYWVDNHLFERDFYYETAINPLYKLIARLMEKVIRLFLRGIYVGY